MAVDVDVLAKYKDNIQHAVGSKFADILEEAVQELRNEGIDNDIDKEAAYKHMAASLASLLDGMSPHQKDRQRPAPHATEPTAAAAAGTVKDADAFAAGAAADAAEASAGGEQSNETPVPQGMPSSQPPAAVTPKEATPPASVVTVRIEPKVEVKIVDVTDETGDAASESNVDESVAVSHSEAHPEGRRIRTVVAILQPAGRDARKEEARQREMEENYNHLWSKKQKVEL